MTGNDCPLISVIIPYYNGRHFIREALQSILDQTYPRVEIIVVDDASPNREDSEYIKKLSDELGFKLIVHSVNKGIGRSMADAAEASSGDFIAELSQDDFYKPKKIEKQIEELKCKKLDAIYTAGDILEHSSGRIRMRDTTQTAKIIRSGRAADYLKSQNLTSISIQGLLAKRSVFEKDIIPIWRDFLLDDWPVNIRLFENYKVGFIEEPLWTGRGHETNTSRNIWKWFGPQIEVVARLAPKLMKAEAIGNRLASSARRLLKQGDRREDIVRIVLAALMLTDSHEQYEKASRVLKRIPSKYRKAVINHKFRILKDAICLSEGKVSFTRTTCKTDWNNIGKEIDEIVRTCPEAERVSLIGGAFYQLAQNMTEDVGDVVKIALGALMCVDDLENESNILRMLESLLPSCSRQLIDRKIDILRLKSASALNLFLKIRELFY